MDLHAEIEKIIEQSMAAVEGLTREQLAEAFVQAIKAGDFVRYVLVGGPHAQQVTYLPWQDAERLKRKLAEFQVYGTDECKNCDTGRITLYFKNAWCHECLAQKSE